MKRLHLNLLYHWFEMIYLGYKKEEYREITPNWASKLLLYKNEHKKCSWWEMMFSMKIDFVGWLLNDSQITPKNHRHIHFANGMTPPVNAFCCEYIGLEIGKGNVLWGADQNKYYFKIKLGKIFNEEVIWKGDFELFKAHFSKIAIINISDEVDKENYYHSLYVEFKHRISDGYPLPPTAKHFLEWLLLGRDKNEEYNYAPRDNWQSITY